MKISYNWLSDVIEWIETDPQNIANTITAATGEVDHVERQGELLNQCVVGRITALRKHPGADRLSLCTVETDEGSKNVVCGGTNLREGQMVAFAHVGATVRWHGGETMTLSRAKIRGEESEGMICAAEELGLESHFPPHPTDGEHPIIDLSESGCAVGEPLKHALGLDDIIFHIDNHAITNRPDLFSHMGVARECVALKLARWKKKKAEKKPVFSPASLPFSCHNEVPSLVPVYRACMVDIESVGQSPEWMKRRLLSVGVRSLNLPIDITNYVMLETGMPMHAFDSADIRGDISIREAREGETLVTLDAKERTLPRGALVMSDDEGIFDLLGIMGGLRSSAKDTTRRIYLHAAVVDPAAIRKAVIATGHRTDAATIYEKGVQAITAEKGLQRALDLMLSLVPGAKISSQLQEWGSLPKPTPIPLSMTRVTAAIGVPLTANAAEDILNALGFEVQKSRAKKDVSLLVTPPLERLHDIAGEHDLIEEIARMYGYGKVTPVMPSACMQLPPRDARLHVLRETLKAACYRELLHLAFVSPTTLTKTGMNPEEAIAIENPLGEELSLMRSSLLPMMLETVSKLQRDSSETLKLYEYGNVFTKNAETVQLCMIVASAKRQDSISQEPVLSMKRDLSHACSCVGYTISYAKCTDPLPAFAHPGRSAAIKVGTEEVGMVCEVHPSVARAFDLEGRVGVVILNVKTLMEIPPSVIIATPLPLFPSIRYDETIPLSSDVSAASILQKARSAHPLLESVTIVDLFRSDTGIRMTLRFVYRSPDRTLEQKATDDIHASILQTLRSSTEKL